MKTLLLLLVFASPAFADSWTLDGYLEQVRASSYDLKKAEEGAGLAGREYVSSLAAFWLPEITLRAANAPYSVYNSPRLTLEKDNTSAAVTASLNLFNNFKDKTALERSKISRDLADRFAWQERQRVTLAALGTYYNVLRKRRLLDVVKTSLGSYEEQFRKTQRYYKDGMKSYSDVLKSELNLRSSQLQEVTSFESYRNALMDFNLSLYRSPRLEAELEDVPSAASVPGPSLDADLEMALENRVEIVAAALELRQAELDQRKGALDALPNLSADLYYNRQGIGSWGRPAAGTVNPVYSATLSLSLPLGPETFSDRKNYLAAKVGLDRQKRALAALKLEVERELVSRALSLETALRTYEVSKMKADISRQSLEIITSRYGVGQAGIIELAEAQRDDLGSQSDLANALYDLLLERAAYDRAAGRQLWK